MLAHCIHLALEVGEAPVKAVPSFFISSSRSLVVASIAPWNFL
jgi:hypothetical protein